MNWTRQHKDLLRQLWTTDMSAAEIALRFGVSKSAVSGQAFRMGLPRKHDYSPGHARLKPSKQLIKKIPKEEKIPSYIDKRGVSLSKGWRLINDHERNPGCEESDRSL